MEDSWFISQPRLLGGEKHRDPSRQVLRRFAGMAQILAGDPINLCLRDGKEHSRATFYPHEVGYVWGLVNVHPGTFQDVSPKLHGILTRRLTSPMLPMEQAVAVVMLDYFVEQPGNRSSIPLAVSFLPIKGDSLPDECQFVLAHREMLSSSEWQQLNESYG